MDGYELLDEATSLIGSQAFPTASLLDHVRKLRPQVLVFADQLLQFLRYVGRAFHTTSATSLRGNGTRLGQIGDDGTVALHGHRQVGWVKVTKLDLVLLEILKCRLGPTDLLFQVWKSE